MPGNAKSGALQKIASNIEATFTGLLSDLAVSSSLRADEIEKCWMNIVILLFPQIVAADNPFRGEAG